MELVDLYNTVFGHQIEADGCDLDLVEYKSRCYVGINSGGYCVLVFDSSTPGALSSGMQTKMLKVEFNANMTVSVSGDIRQSVVHILTCLSLVPGERELFLELAELFADDSDYSEASLTQIFHTLTSFFSERKEPNDAELRGLFAELFTVVDYQNQFNLAPYWHKEGKNKFDFSLSGKEKIEVKSTIKLERRHHFANDQLESGTYKVIVLSYMLRYDDRGLSLFDLLLTAMEVLPLKQQKAIVLSYLTLVDPERLKNMCFDVEYTKERRRFFDASSVPHFDYSEYPTLSSIEFDCFLDDVDALSEEEVLERFAALKNEERIEYSSIEF